MFESMGIATGIDFEKLMAARKALVEGLPEEPVYGHTPQAGLPKNFKRAA
jgi:hydroxymethylglutaryl-CoA lyase